MKYHTTTVYEDTFRNYHTVGALFIALINWKAAQLDHALHLESRQIIASANALCFGLFTLLTFNQGQNEKDFRSSMFVHTLCSSVAFITNLMTCLNMKAAEEVAKIS